MLLYLWAKSSRVEKHFNVVFLVICLIIADTKAQNDEREQSSRVKNLILTRFYVLRATTQTRREHKTQDIKT